MGDANWEQLASPLTSSMSSGENMIGRERLITAHSIVGVVVLS
jgi:hypothetical protein